VGLAGALAAATVAALVWASGSSGPSGHANHLAPLTPGDLAVEFPGDVPLAAEVRLTPSGWELVVDAPTLVWAPEGRHVPGEGHAHVVVDGTSLGSVYSPVVPLDLPAGRRQVTVELFTNDHRPYASSGRPVAVAVDVDVPAASPPSGGAAAAVPPPTG
jgi:hypothetical protein